MFLQFAFLLILLSANNGLTYTPSRAFDGLSHLRPLSEKRGDDDPLRDVKYISQTDMKPLFSEIDGKALISAHGLLYFKATDKDGPLFVEIGRDMDIKTLEDQYHLRVIGFVDPETAKALEQHPGWLYHDAGQTRFSNQELWDPKTGEGRIPKVWQKNMVYAIGPKNAAILNSCNVLLQNLIDDLKLELPERTKKWVTNLIRNARETLREGNPEKPFRIDRMHYDLWGPSRERNEQIKYKMTETTIERISGPELPHPEQGGAFRAVPEWADTRNPLPTSIIDQRPMATVAPDSEKYVPPDKQGEVRVGFGRIGGELKTIIGVAEDVFNKINTPVGTALLGLFIAVWDLMNGDIKGAAISAAAGIATAAALAIEGSAGLIAVAAVAAFFIIIPIFFQKTLDPGRIDNALEIIQWMFFGDRGHSGNEKCEKEHKGCQMLYGPGIIAKALNIYNFDAIVFLIHFNDGYPITLPDLAKAMHIIDPEKEGDGADKVASVDCDNGDAFSTEFGLAGDDPKLCNNPKFIINRKLIKVPNIDETTDRIADRLAPKEGGDCSIFVFPGEQELIADEISITGWPSGVACNLAAAININGVAMPIDKGPGQLVSPGEDSSTGDAGAYMAPDAMSPFAKLTDKEAVRIGFSDQTPQLCLPSGTYGKQDGAFGFKLNRGNSLSIPGDGYTLETSYTMPAQPHLPERAIKNSYDASVKAAETSKFVNDMKNIWQNYNDNAKFTIKSPSDPPMACFTTSKGFKDDVICFGKGGGELPNDVGSKVQSVSLKGNSNAWLYPKKYGEIGGPRVKSDVGDLENEFYGEDGSCNRNVKFVFIRKNE